MLRMCVPYQKGAQRTPWNQLI